MDVKHKVYLLTYSNDFGFICNGVNKVGGYERNAW